MRKDDLRATDKQLALLRRFGEEITHSVTQGEASMLISTLLAEQERTLRSNGRWTLGMTIQERFKAMKYIGSWIPRPKPVQPPPLPFPMGRGSLLRYPENRGEPDQAR